MTNLEKATNYLLKHPGASVSNLAQRIGVSYSYAHKLKQKVTAALATNPLTPEQDAAMDKLITLSQTEGHWQITGNVATPIDGILEQRGNRYGKFTEHAAVTQKLKYIMRTHMGTRYERLDPDQQEALEMIAHKIGRIVNGDPNYHDSWADIAGYAKLVADRLETGKEI